MTESLSPELLGVLTGEYVKTISSLNARMGNAAVNLVMLGQEIEKLKARIVELEKTQDRVDSK